MRLREGATDTFKYRYFVQYADGLVVTSDWKEAKSDEDIPPIDIKRLQNKTLTIDGGLLDWTKWKMVYATVKYQDKANKYFENRKTIRLNEGDFLKSFEIFSFHPGGNEYECTLKYAGNGKVVDAPLYTAKGGILILEDLEGKDEPIIDPLPPEEPDTPEN